MTRTVRAAASAILALGGLVAVGCSSDRPGLQQRFQNVNTNNSWPERYGYQAREPVLYAFEAQANNAAVVDGVMNASYFEPGTERLNPVGQIKLDQLARKMPAPDANIYLQTANDVPVDQTNLQKSVTARAELDTKRAQAILAYMSARPNTQGVSFTVQAIDIADPVVNSAGPSNSVRGLSTQYRSGITGSFGNSLVGVGGGQAQGTLGVNPSNAPPAGAAQPGTGTTGTGTGTGTGTR